MSLAKKLQIKPGHRVLVMNAPDGYLEQLGPLPDGARMAEASERDVDAVQLFVKNVEEVNRLAPVAMGVVKRDGLLWICHPKGTAKVKTDVSRDKGWDAVNDAGWRVVTLVSIDDTWSALRFRPLDLVGK